MTGYFSITATIKNKNLFHRTCPSSLTPPASPSTQLILRDDSDSIRQHKTPLGSVAFPLFFLLSVTKMFSWKKEKKNRPVHSPRASGEGHVLLGWTSDWLLWSTPQLCRTFKLYLPTIYHIIYFFLFWIVVVKLSFVNLNVICQIRNIRNSKC